MTEPTDKEQYLNIADQCAATATSDLAASILVDGGNGTLRQLLNDAADAIRAGWATPQPTQAQAGAITPPPIECNTEELKRAYAFGWWSALEKQRETAQAVAVPLTPERVAEIADAAHREYDRLVGSGQCAPRWSAVFAHLLERAHGIGIKGGQHG